MKRVAPLLLGAALAQTAAAIDLPTCPTATHAVGAAPPAGFEWHCETDSGVPEGAWLTWYESGQLMSERHMKNGREHGRQRSWWPNGQLMMDGVSVDGNRYQGFKYWSIDGSPAQLDVKVQPVPLTKSAQSGK